MLILFSFISATSPLGIFAKGVTLFVSALSMGRICKLIYEHYRPEEE